MNLTIDYYNKNARAFTNNTRDVDFHIMQDKFLEYLPVSGKILDLGCGCGRDTKYFMDKGYDVNAMDGSEELCRMASEYTGIEVSHRMFHELTEKEAYDGIWACASLLHVPSEELPEVLVHIGEALKYGGTGYLSFKYGEFEGERNGRFFLDMTEKKMSELLVGIPELKLRHYEITTDVRPDREERWLNILLGKDA